MNGAVQIDMKPFATAVEWAKHRSLHSNFFHHARYLLSALGVDTDAAAMPRDVLRAVAAWLAFVAYGPVAEERRDPEAEEWKKTADETIGISFELKPGRAAGGMPRLVITMEKPS